MKRTTNSEERTIHRAACVIVPAAFAVLTLALAGCGRAGNLFVPEDYGIGLRLQAERQKEQEQARKEREAREAAARAPQEEREGAPVLPDEVILPDMRPVGTR